MIYILCIYILLSVLASYRLGHIEELFDTVEIFINEGFNEGFPFKLIVTIILTLYSIVMFVISPFIFVIKLLRKDLPNPPFYLLPASRRAEIRKLEKERRIVEEWKVNNPYVDNNPTLFEVPSLTFKAIPTQIIYVEDEYNPVINEFIKDNIGNINCLVRSKSYTFIYLPYAIGNMDNKESIIEYFFPAIDEESKKKLLASWNNPSTSYLSRIIFSALGIPLSELRPGLFRLREEKRWENGVPTFSFVDLSTTKKEEMPSEFVNYFRVPTSHIAGACFARRLEEGSRPDYADNRFDDEMANMAEEVKNKIMQLKQEGYFELLLSTLGKELIDEMKIQTQLPSLSRLVITDKFEIFLPGYNNLEIKMTPLPKAVYILFLRHEKGIRFKMLPEYQQELFSIYSKISSSDSVEQIAESIKTVTNPYRNAINEKCSRIREAFLVHFDDYFARNYYVTGKRGEEKKVILSSSMIQLPDVLKNIPLTIPRPF